MNSIVDGAGLSVLFASIFAVSGLFSLKLADEVIVTNIFADAFWEGYLNHLLSM